MKPEERAAMVLSPYTVDEMYVEPVARELAGPIAQAIRYAEADERVAIIRAIKDLLWDQPTDNFEMRRNDILRLAIQVVAARQ